MRHLRAATSKLGCLMVNCVRQALRPLYSRSFTLSSGEINQGMNFSTSRIARLIASTLIFI
jgi:hypothetical protein